MNARTMTPFSSLFLPHNSTGDHVVSFVKRMKGFIASQEISFIVKASARDRK